MDITQSDKTRHPGKFSYTRLNIRNASHSRYPTTKRRSTTREMQW
jgi:hypothetical protein